MKKPIISRRNALKSGSGLITAATLPYIITRSAAAFTNDPGSAATVKFGFNASISGPYAADGLAQEKGVRLAVKHINGTASTNGVLETMKPIALTGDGILGKKLELVEMDSKLEADVAMSNAKKMITDDGVLMITGGSSSSITTKVQDLCDEAGVICMVGSAQANDITGKNRRKHGFRYGFNAYMGAEAMVPAMTKLYGNDRKLCQLSADYSWGHAIEESFEQLSGAKGWETVKNIRVSLDEPDIMQFMDEIKDSGADILALNLFGEQLTAGLEAVNASGIKGSSVNGKNFEVFLPVYDRNAAVAAGRNADGVLGAINWHWTMQDPGSRAFVQSFGLEYGHPPSRAAHMLYAQTILYADACARAQSFNPCAVIEALEDYNFDGVGVGPSFYRGEDHQCFKDMVVATRRANPASKFDVLEIVETTPQSQIEYSPNHPMFAGGMMKACKA